MPTEPTITRRTAGLLLTGALASLACPSHAQTDASPSGGLSSDARAAELNAREATANLQGNNRPASEIWSLNGTAQGPVLRTKVGDICDIAVRNETFLPLSLHWHGVRIDNAMDGVGGLTQEPVSPGNSFTYRFMPPEPGTFLIRPCMPGSTSELCGRGLSGLLIVEEPQPTTVDMELCAIVNDWLLDADGQFQPFGDMPLGRLGNTLSVNGSPAPYVLGARAGARVRLRLANACNARSFRIRFDQVKVFVIAVDGQPTEAFEPLRSSLPFSPGNRYDIVFDMPAEGVGGALVAMIGDGRQLLSFRSRGNLHSPLPEIVPPKPNSKLPRQIRLQDASRYELTVAALADSGKAAPKGWTINGLQGATGNGAAFSVKQGTPVVLAIRNDTPVPQPFHIHGHCFRLLHPFDDGWDPFWMDTLQIPAQTAIRIAFIAGSPGKWLLASTVCERFDTGLWTWFEIV